MGLWDYYNRSKIWPTTSNLPIITVFSFTLPISATSVASPLACYELKSLELDKRTNSCIRVNTRELDRDPFAN